MCILEPFLSLCTFFFAFNLKEKRTCCENFFSFQYLVSQVHTFIEIFCGIKKYLVLFLTKNKILRWARMPFPAHICFVFICYSNNIFLLSHYILLYQYFNATIYFWKLTRKTFYFLITILIDLILCSFTKLVGKKKE